jgi:hypothetical protein
MRLNRWQLIGIVLSGAWILAGPPWIHRNVEHQVMYRNVLEYRACRAGPTDPAVCEARSQQSRDDFLNWTADTLWGLWAFLGLLPVIAVWLLAYALVFLTRWMLAAFRSTRP